MIYAVVMSSDQLFNTSFPVDVPGTHVDVWLGMVSPIINNTNPSIVII